MYFLLALFIVFSVNAGATNTEIKLNKGQETLDKIARDKALLQKKQQEQARLQRIKKNISKAKKIELEINNINKKIIVLNADIDILKGEIDLLDAKEFKEREKLGSKIKSFNNTALNITRLERMPLEAMALASSLRDAYRRKGVIEMGRKSLNKDIKNNRNKIYSLQNVRLERETKIAEMNKLLGKRLNKKKKLEALFAKQVELLALDDSQKAKMLSNAYKMKQKNSLNDIFKNYKKEAVELPFLSEKIKNLPVNGQIVKGYNYKDKNGVLSHGITISSTYGETVSAVANGRVVFSDTFRNYGYIVILEHADGANSLYSGNWKSDKKVGDFVHAEEVMGTMQNNEKVELYFEVRKNNKTINPIKYITKK